MRVSHFQGGASPAMSTAIGRGRTSRSRCAPPGVWLLLLIVCMMAPGIAQATNEETLARAEKSLRQGREAASKIVEARRCFGAAAEACAELHRGGVASPELFLLWGNAELLADRLPRALWAFHAGLRLDPNHRGLRAHLAHARSRVAAAQTERTAPRADDWSAWLPAPWPALLAAALAFAVACASAAVWHVERCPRCGWFTLLALALTVVTAFGCGLSIVREQREQQHPRVVIAEADTPLTLGNGPNYAAHPATPRLPAGAEARLAHRRGGWLRIELPAGDVGWIPAANALVVPSTR